MIIESVGGYRKRRGIFTSLVLLQTIKDAPLPITLENEPYAPLSVVSKYIENDLECDNGNNLITQNLWKMYSCERPKINKVCTHIVFLHKF